jgi:hypothetical protein
LNKRTSINSIPNILKEKEMADFRKMLFAFAAVALLAGLTVPANAQSTCTVGSGVNTLIRAEGYTDLVGDIVLTCTGGTPTATGVIVPQVDFLVTLNGTITSRITASLTGGSGASMTEALLLADDPNSTKWNNSVPHPISNCGRSGEDSSPAGPGVCSIVSTGTPAQTYDGTAATPGVYGTGRPNVFQGRQASVLAGSISNTVQFLGIPYDPPAPGANRTIRIVNLRVNGNGYGVASPFSTVPVIATISISNNSSISLTNTSVQVGQVEQGLISQVTSTAFLQCESTGISGNSGSPALSGIGPNAPKAMKIRVLENFATAFKVKNIAQILGNGILAATNYVYAGTLNYPADNDQNVPGAVYGTETGFYFPPTNSSAFPGVEPPSGFGSPVLPGTPAATIGTRFSNGGTNTGISIAGLANQGTRISVTTDPAPTGTTLYYPLTVALKNQATGAQTGILQLIATDSAGANLSLVGYSVAAIPVLQATPPATGVSTVGYGPATNNNFAVYEVLFSDPNSQEYADILPQLFYVTNLATNTPPPSTITAAVSFAPTYAASTGANLPSATLPIPRFAPSVGPNATLYTIAQCRCNLLFPWVVGGGGYVTSIVVDNTSADPFGTLGATGTVTFNYYGTNGVSTNPTNTGTFAAQTTTAGVPPGSYAVDIITSSGGGGTAGLSSLSGPFAGYVISQANFQFCHGVASISGNGIQPQTYVGLEMDSALSSRTGSLSEVLGH